MPKSSLEDIPHCINLCQKNDRGFEDIEAGRTISEEEFEKRTPQDPWRYPWSSHAAYLGETTPVDVDTEVVLAQFHRQVGPARRAYREFLREGLPQGHQAQYYETVDQRFLGDAHFLEALERKSEPTHEIVRRDRPIPFPRILRAVADVTGTSKLSLAGRGRQRALVAPRAVLVYAARTWWDLTMKDLGRCLQRDPSLMSRLYTMYLRHRQRRWEERVRRLVRQ